MTVGSLTITEFTRKCSGLVALFFALINICAVGCSGSTKDSDTSPASFERAATPSVREDLAPSEAEPRTESKTESSEGSRLPPGEMTLPSGALEQMAPAGRAKPRRPAGPTQPGAGGIEMPEMK